MKVSVALVTYNHGPFIKQAIESVLAQKLDADWELVIGDDNSTDGTKQLLLEYRQKFPQRIRLLLSESNAGDSGRTNFIRTLNACRGEYVAYLDGDDCWIRDDKLATQLRFLEAHPGASACSHAVTRLYDDGRCDMFAPYRPRLEYELGQVYRNHAFLHGSAFMYRQAVLPSLPEWFADPAIKLDDWTLTVLCARSGPVGYVDEVLGLYRKHSGGIWSAMDAPQRLIWDLQTRECLARNVPGLAPPRRTAARFLRHLALAGENVGDGRVFRARWHLSQAALAFPYRHSFSLTYAAIFIIELWLGFLKPALLAGRAILRKLLAA